MNVQRSSLKPSVSFHSRTEASLSTMELIPVLSLPPRGGPPSAWLTLVIVLALTIVSSCRDETTVCDSEKGDFCDQCFGNVYTCSYDGVSVTARACEGCQAKFALYDELCALGRTESRAEVDESMVCEIADTGA